MLLFLLTVDCFFLFHNKTQKFIGEEKDFAGKDKLSSYPHPAPVAGVERAIDFKLGKSKDASGIYITIENPLNSKSFDVQTGGNRTGLPLIFYASHGQGAQSFQLVLTVDNTFALAYKDKCLVFNDSKNGFQLGSCNNISGSTFDIYYEVPPTPDYIKEQTFRLNSNYDSNNVKDMSFESNLPFLSAAKPRVIRELVLADGTVKSRSLLKGHEETNDLKIAYAPVVIKRKRKSTKESKHARKFGRLMQTANDGSSSSHHDHMGIHGLPVCKGKNCDHHHLIITGDHHDDSSDIENNGDLHNKLRHTRLHNGQASSDNGADVRSPKGIYV